MTPSVIYVRNNTDKTLGKWAILRDGDTQRDDTTVRHYWFYPTESDPEKEADRIGASYTGAYWCKWSRDFHVFESYKSKRTDFKTARDKIGHGNIWEFSDEDYDLYGDKAVEKFIDDPEPYLRGS